LRQEDKQVDGVELEREEERRRGSELVEDDAEAIHELDSRSASDRDEPRTAVIAGAMHQILDGEHIIVEELELSQRQARALEALKTATCGRDQKLDAFVYAEDRRALLEQALAVLQPDLAVLQQLGGSAFEELLHGRKSSRRRRRRRPRPMTRTTPTTTMWWTTSRRRTRKRRRRRRRRRKTAGAARPRPRR